MTSPPIAITADPADPPLLARARQLAESLHIPLHTPASTASILLVVTPTGLELRTADLPDRGGIRIDLAGNAARFARSRTNTRNQPLVRALGFPPAIIADATAGFGEDAIHFASLGWNVIAIERSPIIAAMFTEDLARSHHDPAFQAFIANRLTFIPGDAAAILPTLTPAPDVIYIDPMFPPKRKASALPPKEIQLLRALVGHDDDAPALLNTALRIATRRVIVKRADDSPPLLTDPAITPVASHRGKTVRYDVYLPAARRLSS